MAPTDRTNDTGDSPPKSFPQGARDAVSRNEARARTLARRAEARAATVEVRGTGVRVVSVEDVKAIQEKEAALLQARKLEAEKLETVRVAKQAAFDAAVDLQAELLRVRRKYLLRATDRLNFADGSVDTAPPASAPTA